MKFTITTKNSYQKRHFNHLKLIHTELKKWFKSKQNKENQKRHLLNLERKEKNKEQRDKLHLLKLERKEKNKEKLNKLHQLKLERKEKNKWFNNLFDLLNLEYIKSDDDGEKINTKLILQMFKTGIKLDHKDHLKLVHFELKLKLKFKNNENKFNTILLSLKKEVENEVENEVVKDNVVKNKVNKVENLISLHSLHSLNSLQIVRAGCILRYKKNNTFHYILNKSNRNYLSDFGGGIKKNESWKDGLYRELKEECPWMKEYIEMHIETEINIQLFLEQSKVGKCSESVINKLLIVIDLYNEPEYITQFHKTDEVKDLIVLNSQQLKDSFKYKTILNYGILQLKNLVSNGSIDL